MRGFYVDQKVLYRSGRDFDAASFLLRRALRFQDNTLQFFKYRKLFIRMVNFGIPLLFTDKKADLFQPLQFPLDVTGIFFDKFGQAANVRLEVRILRINNYNFAANT